jgi:hypothetical protein
MKGRREEEEKRFVSNRGQRSESRVGVGESHIIVAVL